jgi:ABC-type Mn2+/Zn2+ transport system permease subunit
MTPSDVALPATMAVAAGLVGCFAVMRRMTLASDAISHVALPGIALALALHLHPLIGGLAALLLGTILIWALEHKTGIPTETVIGVVFSVALAVGTMLTSGEELIEALLGAPEGIGRIESLLGLAGAVVVIAFVLRARDRLVIALVSPDLARTVGIDVAHLDLLFLLAFALTVALGLRYLGVLLMGSLLIIPAATAKHLASSLNGMFLIAIVVAVTATLLGLLAAPRLQVEPGPLIVALAGGMFFVGLLRRRRA